MATGPDQPIRVGFDDQIFEAQRRGGISKYFLELIERLPDHGIEPVLLSEATRNLHLVESGLVPRAPSRPAWQERLAWASWRAVGRPRSTPEPLPSLDIMHHTFTQAAYLRAWNGPRVMTIFDMTPELFPEYFRLGNPHLAKRRYAAVSDAIISISQNTAADMLRLYDLPGLAAKTRVIPFGVGRQFFGAGTPVPDLPDRYLLFVGVRAGYKDFGVALEAWAALADTDPELHLVVAGGGPLSATETVLIGATQHADRVHQLTPRDDEIVELYRRAAVFVFPSRYEGFGLPTLEALAAGTPTVLADASCSREVGGDAALYFPPGDVPALASRLREALSGEYAAGIRAHGPAHAGAFTWDLAAARTAEVYRDVLAHRLA